LDFLKEKQTTSKHIRPKQEDPSSIISTNSTPYKGKKTVLNS